MAENQTRSQKLHDKLRLIISGTKPGDRLLTEPELARQLGVSRATLREAMRTFETQGLIRRRQGAGTFVIHPSYIIESGLEVLESIETLANRIGLNVMMGELKVEYRSALKEEAEALNLETGDRVAYLSRVIQAEGRPVAFLVDILPEDILNDDDLEKGFTGSVLDLLLRRGTPALVTSRTEINAVTATPEVARALGIQRGDVLLRFSAHLYAGSGRVVDYSFSYFLPGYFKFHVVRRVG
ncbi:MAG: GntR family transcriptional regulator [Chloroflexota bacterium]|nr:MAG: GntR family transcriptional regulator [Chloroflexota bacterium]